VALRREPSRARRRPETSPTAFTLIELLVVIAVIALLIGLLLPALGKAQRTARDAKCLSNLRQISIGFNTYANDYGTFPWQDDWESGSSQYRFGWGGVHWYGVDGSGEPIVPDVHPVFESSYSAVRPMNEYVERPSLLLGADELFKCPNDFGIVTPAYKGQGIDVPEEDPWAEVGVGNASGEGDQTIYGKFGTSYQPNPNMYTRWRDQDDDGKYDVGEEESGPFHGPGDVRTSHSKFVVMGDVGMMTAANPDKGGLDFAVQGWWHGYAKGNMAFLDGSARLVDVVDSGEQTSEYTFSRGGGN